MATSRRSPPPARFLEHLRSLRASGFDTAALVSALVAIRQDTGLPPEQREALYRMIAMESMVWYLEALRGEPIDRVALAADAGKLVKANASPRDFAALLERYGSPPGDGEG